MGKDKQPDGVIGIFTNPKGAVVASVNVFETGRPAGFTLLEMQKIIARNRLAFEVAKAYSSPAYVEAMDDNTREKTMRAMMNNGYTATYLTIGHDNEGEKNE